MPNITITDFLGIRRAALPGDVPISLIGGLNGAGKSSLLAAIRLALLAEPERISLKKDYGQLVRSGAKAATIEWGMHALTIDAAGKVTDGVKGCFEPKPALPFALSPHRFASLSPDERRTALFTIMGQSASADDVRRRLLDRGCDADKIEAVIPLLRSGFPVAAETAAKRATEAKGAWRATTGETYGASKAAGWKAGSEALTEAEAQQLTAADKAIEAAKVYAEEAQRALGSAQAEHAAHRSRLEDLAKARTVGATFASTAGLRNQALRDVQEWEAKVRAASEVRAQRRVDGDQGALPCPACGVFLVRAGNALLQMVPAPTAPQSIPEDDQGRLAEAENSLALCRRVLARHEADLKAADLAAAKIKLLEEQTGGTLPDLAGPKAAADKASADLESLRLQTQALRAKVADYEIAKGKTARAAGFHAEVVDWAKIAEALAPDGIPGEILSAALRPINERLAEQASNSGWRPVWIADDMAITFGARDYALLSESEKWRADAMIAESLSYFGGVYVLLLDRFDVLDMAGRSAATNWLVGLANTEALTMCIVTGTLKAPPTVAVDGVLRSYWLQDGGLSAGPQGSVGMA
jgi:hypothetical protein